MSVCLSDSMLSNTFVKVLVSVHVPVCQKKALGTALLPPTYFFGLKINMFFVRLVNETLSNFKFNVFIITRSVFSNKYVNQIILINQSWISPTLQKDGDWSFVYSSKNGEGYISLKKKGRLLNSRGIKVAEEE